VTDKHRRPLTAASATLDDLPPHRRDALLWRYALELDYDGVDDLVRAASAGGR
jgi:hypothetical protein